MDAERPTGTKSRDLTPQQSGAASRASTVHQDEDAATGQPYLAASTAGSRKYQHAGSTSTGRTKPVSTRYTDQPYASNLAKQPEAIRN